MGPRTSSHTYSAFKLHSNTVQNFHSRQWISQLWVYLYLINFVCAPTHTQAIRWLGIYRLPRGADHPVDSKADRFTSAECHTATVELGLRRRQSWFCNHPKFGFAMLAVLRAAHAVGYHCPKAFADRRWNCTSIHRLPEVSPELKRGTREQALVHAFSSAALLFEIGRYCALNKIRFCSCDEESAAQPITDFLTQSMNGQTVGANQDGALVYQTGSEVNMVQTSATNTPSNANPVADGQSTVSRYYWTGCSDNIRVAREYVAAFLGISTNKLLRLSAADIEKMNELRDVDESKLERYSRSAQVEHNSVSMNEENQGLVSEVDEMVNSFRIKRELDYPWLYKQQNDIQPPRPSNAYSNQQRRLPFMHDKPVNSRQLSDRPWRGRTDINEHRSRAHMTRILDKHNYLAGVALMEANHKLVCKCHGVSGSCAHRVCFRQLRRIDDEIMQMALKSRYLAAKHVTLGKKRQLIAKSFTGTGFVDEVVKLSELVFSEHSPDYCNVEPHRGSVGTHGRKCTLKNTGTAHCMNMCCGRGYINLTSHDIVQCNCRMGDGFKVRCDECRKEVITQQCL